MIKIVDYGMGNLRSVQKAFERLGTEAEVCSAPSELSSASHLVLPGVGAFRDAARALQDQELVAPIRQHIDQGKPFLGICLGLQLLFDVSFEDGEWQGLGIVPGSVKRFEERPGLKVPHMGWNQLIRTQPDHPLWNGIPEAAYFYFVHSYYVAPQNAADVAAMTDYGTQFVSAVARDNLMATQFHPEKSQRYGLQLLQNFAAMCTPSPITG